MSQQEQPFWIIKITSNNKTQLFDVRTLFAETNFENELTIARLKDNLEPIYHSEFISLKALIERLIPEVFERATEIISSHPEKKVLYDPESQYLFLDDVEVKNFSKLPDGGNYCEVTIWVELYGYNTWDEPTYLYDTRGMVCFSYKIKDLTTVLSLEIDDMV
ncbi:MAG: hypothetical protein QE487_13715 [Fluviicola sp.]|nr:hypothetical protein [Fluviicola sp.]